MPYGFESRFYADDGSLMCLVRPSTGVPRTNTEIIDGWAIDRKSGCSYIELVGSASAVPSGTQLTKWGRVTSDGALCVTQETSPTSGDYVHQSIRYRNDNVMYAAQSGDPTTSSQQTRLGRLTGTGAMVLDGLSFVLPLSDSGSGAVNTTPLFGTGGATFTRATSATTILSNRTIGNVASGTARSYYFPDGTYGGYLAEGQRTNLVLAAENFSFAWAVVGTPTRTAAFTACGTVSLDLIGDDDGAVLEGYTQTVTFTGNAVKAISLFVRQNTSTSSVVRLRDTTGAADRLLGVITWSAGVPVVSMTTGTFEGTDALANGIYRIRFETTSVTAANTNSLQVYPATDAALSVGNTGNIGMGGVQAEDGTFCSTYIPTVSATVTRNADVLTYAVAGNQSEAAGTCYAEYRPNATSNQPRVVGQSVAASTLLFAANNGASASFFDGTNTVGSVGGSTTSMNKGATSWSGTTGVACTNGGVVATGNYAGAFGLANIGIGVGGSEPLFGAIKNIQIRIRAIPSAQLQSITA